MIPVSSTHCQRTRCKNEVDEDLEEGEIVEDDINNFESTEKNTEIQISNDNLFVECVKEKNFKHPWKVEQRPHQQMIKDPIHTTFARFDNSWLGQNLIPGNKETIVKQDVTTLMDKPWHKKSRFDQNNKNKPILKNNQNRLLNRRKIYDTSMKREKAGNDEEMSNVRGTNSLNVSNFKPFPQEFENREELLNKFSSRGREKQGVNMDRSSRTTPIKRHMTNLDMKYKKICQYFLRGKCFKGNNCVYTHQNPKRRKMKLCKFYLMNRCALEKQCEYMHSDFPCKYYHTGMNCFAGKYCRFSHAKIDDDKKYTFMKNSFVNEQILCTKNNFVPESDKSKIPSSVEMQISVSTKLKSTDNNPDEYLEGNHNNNNSSTPMPLPPSQDGCLWSPMIDKTLKYQKYNNMNKTGKQEKEFEEIKIEHRQEEPKIEKNRQYVDLFEETNIYPSFSDLSDEDIVKDLVIDEGFQNYENDQFELLPKKQKKLFRRIQVRQKNYYLQNNEIDMSEDCFSQKDSYSSKVEQVYLYETNNDVMDKLPNKNVCVDKSTIKNQSSPFNLYPLKMPCNFDETFQEKKSSIEEVPVSPESNYSRAEKLGKTDTDLRLIFPNTGAPEIDAFLDSHPPIKYHMIPF